MKVNHVNRLNQGFAAIKGEVPGKAARKVTKSATTLKLSAAALRAIQVAAPAKERDAVAAEAIRLAELDDRAIRRMVWDCHVYLALGGRAVRPGVADEGEVRAWRKGLGLKAPAVESPRAA